MSPRHEWLVSLKALFARSDGDQVGDLSIYASMSLTVGLLALRCCAGLRGAPLVWGRVPLRICLCFGGGKPLQVPGKPRLGLLPLAGICFVVVLFAF